MKMDIYYANIFKREHEKNMTRLWCKIMLRLVLNKQKEMKGFTFIYTLLEI
jgi:hypothetical protein